MIERTPGDLLMADAAFTDMPDVQVKLYEPEGGPEAMEEIKP